MKKKKFFQNQTEFFEKRASQAQSEGTSRVADTRTCFRCEQVGHIARKCTYVKPRTEAVKVQQKKVDVKAKAPMYVEKKVVEKKNVKIDNVKAKTEPVKKLVTQNDKFYKRVAETQQVWKPKIESKVEKKVSNSEEKKAAEPIIVDYDANFPPLKAEHFKIQIARVKVAPKADEAWVDSMFD